MNATITFKTRTLGWGYETQPTGYGTEIEIPHGPLYMGTYRQLMRTIQNERTYQSLISGGTFVNTAWFLNSRRITHIWGGYFASDEDREARPVRWSEGWLELWRVPERMDEYALRKGLRVRTDPVGQRGRRPAAGTKRQGRITITLPPETIELLQARGNVSEFVREAIARILVP